MRSQVAVQRQTAPDWLFTLLGMDRAPTESVPFELAGKRYVLDGPIVRAETLYSSQQTQTADTFGFKWHQTASFDSESSLRRVREWLIERYGPVAEATWWSEYGDTPVLLDAGCGAAMSSLALFGSFLNSVHYVATDISEAVDVAASRCAGQGVRGAFLQADLTALPFAPGSIDVIFAEGVLHHTDSTRDALRRLAELLVPGGRFLFYVYNKKGPVREFTDDYIRERLRELSPEDAQRAVEPLTRLGIVLGELGIEVEIPEDIDLLEIPAGRYDIQRLFYWHVAKAFHHPDLSFDELNLINYDWYGPANAHRQTPEEVRTWCDEAGLEIERQHVESAGITVIARRRR
jgi:arsenite methyltransferase